MTSNHFWCDQVLHVPVWVQCHTSSWSQTLAKDLCTKLCNTCFDSSCTVTFSVDPHSSHCINTKLNSSLLLKPWPPALMPCPNYHYNTTRMPVSGTKFSRFQYCNYTNIHIFLGNHTPNCTKRSLSKGSHNDPEWLACPPLYHSWAQSNLPLQGWALCGARLLDVASTNSHTVPPSLQEQIVSELHKAHPGVAHMKATTCSHV